MSVSKNARPLGLRTALLVSMLSAAFLAASAGPQENAGFLWVAESNGLLNIATDAGEVRFQKPHTLGYNVVAVNDVNGDVWAYQYPELVSYDRFGNVLSTTAVPANPHVDPVDMVVDGTSGNLWIAAAANLYRYNLAGEHQETVTLPTPAVGLTLDRANSILWVGLRDELRAYDTSADLADSVPLTGAALPTGWLYDLAHDRTLGELWVARGDKLERYDGAGNVTFTQSGDFKGAISPDGANGLWIAFLTGLRHVSPTGTTDVQLEPFADQPHKLIVDLVGDPTDASVWVASANSIRHYAVDGERAHSVESATGTVQKIARSALYSDLDPPEVQFQNPAPNSQHSTSTPIFNLSYFDLGVGVDQASIKFKVDGVSISVNCTTATASAECVPASALAEGTRAIAATVADAVGNVSVAATLSIFVDTVHPVITVSQPANGLFTAQSSLTILGSVSEPSTFTVNGAPVTLDGSNGFSYSTTLTEGSNGFSLIATDSTGNSGSASLQVTLDTAAPAVPTTGLIAVGPPNGGSVTVSGAAGSVEAGSVVTIRNLRTGQTVTVTAGADGSFSAQIAAVLTDLLSITQTDRAGNVSDGLQRYVVPQEPSGAAPALSQTEVTSFSDANTFLYTGSNPIQTGVAPGTITATRVNVLRGRVLARDGSPIPAVGITVKDHPEFGQTVTRNDGMFDMVVNGGGVLTIEYAKAGYLRVQRQLETQWQNYDRYPDVVLTQLDSQVSTIDPAANVMQSAQGSVQTDSDGSRQATVLFPAGTQATMTLPNGSQQALGTMHVRATEYTVGDAGPEAMPGQLSIGSGYTYAAELSIDEAIAAGAQTVSFNQPLPVYVDNFQDFPVGGAVPSGYYDATKSAWIPSTNGRVIKVLGTDGQGLALLDIDGSGNAASAAALAGLGITDPERAKIATLYSTGKTLWRIALTHFTPWDFNWPFGLPPDATAPPVKPEPENEKQDSTQATPECGCDIEAQNQTLGEQIPLTGSPYSLHYRSDRQPGNLAPYTLEIPLRKGTLPFSLGRIDLTVDIAGKSFAQSFSASDAPTYTFVWDGKDAYGRRVNGQRKATVTVKYAYGAFYYPPSSFYTLAFAAASNNPGSQVGRSGRGEVNLSRTWHAMLGKAAAGAQGVGGWSLSVHHAYDPVSRTLYLGNGKQITGGSINGIIKTIAGTGTAGFSGDGGPATDAKVNTPQGTAIGPDGSVYFTDRANHRVRRIAPDGVITTVAGNGSATYGGDGGSALNASLNTPIAVLVGPDNSIYIGDFYNHRVRKVSPTGIISTVAGTGVADSTGDGGLATLAQINAPGALALARDGSLYIADYVGNRFRRVGPDGIITTIAGTGQLGFSGDGGPATQAKFGERAYGIALAPDDTLYLVDHVNHRIRRVTPDGVITTVAGNGTRGYGGDGGPALNASFDHPTHVALGPDGSLYVTDFYNNRLRRIGPDGIINTIAGTGVGSSTGDNGVAAQATLNPPIGVSIGPDGSIYVSDFSGHRVRRIQPFLPGFSSNDQAITSPDGSELYQFNSGGRHLKTFSTLTGKVLYTFSYDAAGYLTGITDRDGDQTVIQRNGAVVSGIITPDGQTTVLVPRADGYLATVTDPAGNSYQLGYDTKGLLETFEKPGGNASQYDYDNLGRLALDTDPATGGWTLTRADVISNGSKIGHTVTMTSGEGRQSSYTVKALPNGDRRQDDVLPDGTTKTRLFKPSGQEVNTAPDGTQVTSTAKPDPRFGIQAPLPGTVTVTTAGGPTSTTTTTASATLTNPNDPLSLSSLTRTTNVNGKSYSQNFVAATRTWTMTSPESRQTLITLDTNERPVTSQFANLEATSYSYTTQGRLDSATTGSGNSARTTDFTYYSTGASKGFLESVTDAENRTVSYEYDLAGRVTKQTLPDGRYIQYGYDANGNLTSLTPPGRDAHVFSYTSRDLEQDYTPPTAQSTGTNVTAYQYNLDKDLDLITRPDGQTVDFVYNSGVGKKLSSIITPSGTYGYTYEADGQLDTLSAPGGQLLKYDYNGFLVTSEQAEGAVAGTVSWGYNNDFRVTSQSVNGSALSFGYDNDGLLTTAGAITLTRNATHGLITGTTLATNTTTAHTYNTFGEPATDTATYNGTTLYSASYTTRDKLGRITAKSETVQGTTHNYVYTYDTAGRLDTVTKDGVLVSDYGYDSNGNRTTINGSTVATYDGQDRLLTYGNATYTYTANGELATKTVAGVTTAFGYDVLGNLRTVTKPGDPSIEYVVDGRNRRVGKKVNGTLVQGFLYGDQLDPIAELDGQGNVVTRFVYASRENVPDYMVKNGVTYRIVTDDVGSPRLVVNASNGSVVQSLEFDEFGNVVTDTNPRFQPFGFAGGLYDSDTQLTQFGARDYDPMVGRWTAKDPIRFAGGDLNLYGYVLNDPINLVDLDGYEPRGGERGRSANPAGSGNEYKHMKPHPSDPKRVIYEDPQTGHKTPKAKPEGFDEYWNKKHPPKPPRGGLIPPPGGGRIPGIQPLICPLCNYVLPDANPQACEA